MQKREERTDHFLVGERVEVDGEVGVILAVIEHTVETETHRRVLVDVADRQINSATKEVELLR